MLAGLLYCALDIGKARLKNNEPTLHPVIYSYWHNPDFLDADEEGLYPKKRPPHGVKCGGCFKCAHCPPENANDPMHNHTHGWWREDLMIDDEYIDIPEKDVVEWVVMTESYVSGHKENDDPNRMTLAHIGINIYPVYKDHKEDPHDKPNIVARAPTYLEALKKYEEYIGVAIRRERAKFMK